MKIYHNPRCRKSRETLALIEEKGLQPEVIEYLNNPLTASELKEVLGKLDMPAASIIRKGESIFKEQFKGKDLSEEQWIQAMVDYPKLIERPIVVKGNAAVIGRPPENVLSLL